MTTQGEGLFSLKGTRALITGSSRGIGLALAYGLAQAGAKIILNGTNREVLAQTEAKMREDGFDVYAAPFDVTDRHAVNTSVTHIEQDIGAIDILINNAGIQRRAPLDTFPPEEWDQVINVNLTSLFNVSQAVSKGMIERQQGKIINICSVMSMLARPTVAPYTAAKGGVAMLTKGMCADWAKHNIQANGISPGYFMTKMNQALVDNKAFNDWVCQRTPAGRWGQVQELCGAAGISLIPGFKLCKWANSLCRWGNDQHCLRACEGAGTRAVWRGGISLIPGFKLCKWANSLCRWGNDQHCLRACEGAGHKAFLGLLRSFLQRVWYGTSSKQAL